MLSGNASGLPFVDSRNPSIAMSKSQCGGLSLTHSIRHPAPHDADDAFECLLVQLYGLKAPALNEIEKLLRFWTAVFRTNLDFHDHVFSDAGAPGKGLQNCVRMSRRQQVDDDAGI